MAEVAQNSPFVKQLASSDRHTRDNALQSLRAYLGGKKGFEELELLKLWKGLFFCMWMSDKPLVQQRLANDLAGLVEILPRETVLPFLDAFWKTIAREWNGIDSLRMNKFLLLIRRYLFASWKFLSRQQWRDIAAVSAYLEILRATPLNATDSKIPNGLRLHVIDIYVDELDRMDEAREGHMPLKQIMKPIRLLVKGSPTKPVREHAKEAAQDERLADWNGEKAAAESSAATEQAEEEAGESMDEDEHKADAEWGGIDD